MTVQAAALPPAELSVASRLVCAELRGGNHPVYETVELPGLTGVLYSSPCGGGRGGDVHYLSVCGSGLLARVCVADVAGHGDALAAVGAEVHAQLRRSVDTPDERRVLRALDRRLAARQSPLTTLALLTYYPPSRRLTVSYAGHPHGWIYRAADAAWSRLEAGSPTPRSGPLVDLPLATGLSPGYARRRMQADPGDRVLLVTDGVLEAPAPDGREFGDAGVAQMLGRAADSCAALGDRLLDALHRHTERDTLTHDDVTFFVGEVVEGPPGPALWHVLRNRILRPLVGP